MLLLVLGRNHYATMRHAYHSLLIIVILPKWMMIVKYCTCGCIVYPSNQNAKWENNQLQCKSSRKIATRKSRCKDIIFVYSYSALMWKYLFPGVWFKRRLNIIDLEIIAPLMPSTWVFVLFVYIIISQISLWSFIFEILDTFITTARHPSIQWHL